ncbi:BREX-1 system adenine-specific DNA-methyltransferase PglX [Natroniella acetigena]|uniref:Eco57I restriction-modification methylase domain-containing protein n=1 Tax=Natroniella acetigena TaxID=52004 RepID=UPI00200A11F0|nr:DNA methyltransferase [Natroniella acetigena]MCK8826340.1 BREX-1 system adenine-specific DNA-methyltransferase PglX [Natroniella acetigena]
MKDKKIMDIDKIASKFYSSYKKIHDKFIESINGIKDDNDKNWYTSLMLNRLMITYFVQKKGLLNNDSNYLKNKYKKIEKLGYDFYKNFLLVLFYNGFNNKFEDRSSQVEKIIGQVPYLNGGMFDVHYLEEEYNNIEIDNRVFKIILDFFDNYNWHLNEKNLNSKNQITPKIIGYVFENYINQKEKGAYYTKRDTTDYITQYTLIPFILYKLKARCPQEFERGGLVWETIIKDIDKYIYSTVKKGINEKLPTEIVEGLNDFNNRLKWDKTLEKSSKELKEEVAVNDIMLTKKETWREVINRRKRYETIHDWIEDIKENKKELDIKDFIMYNLNLKKFIKNLIKNSNEKFIKELYYILSGKNTKKDSLKILDPACGSGAFLFSALDLLETIYLECINKIEKLINQSSVKLKSFEELLNQMNQYSSKNYFICKKIITDNLYGVDIMEEAVEITKMRLILRLVSFLKENDEIKMLPNIDSNIVCGNSLMGFSRLNNIKKEHRQEIEKEYNELLSSEKDYNDKKSSLKSKLDVLLFEYYKKGAESINNIECDINKEEFEKYKLFHWFLEFPSIVDKSNGFDCIIGNPPYVRHYKVEYEKTAYRCRYKTKKCYDLAAFITERSYELLKNKGHIGIINPLSMVSTPAMSSLRNLILDNSQYVYFSNFDDRPGTLFKGVHKKLAILLSRKGVKFGGGELFTTGYYHWYSGNDKDERKFLFENLEYVPNNISKGYIEKCIFKVGAKLGKGILKKVITIQQIKNNLNNILDTNKESLYYVYLNDRMTFWTKCFLGLRERGLDNGLDPKQFSNAFEKYYIDTDDFKDAKVIMAVLNSNLFFYYWQVVSDCWHITKGKDLKLFAIDLDNMDDKLKEKLAQKAVELEKDINKYKKVVNTAQTKIEYKHKKSKNIIDEIDKLLAVYYNLTDEELDYLRSYNLKYRLSNSLEEYIDKISNADNKERLEEV